jgi:thioester reductase-like protein
MNAGGILVTGANGFLGCHLLAQFQQRGTAPLRALVHAPDPVIARRKLGESRDRHGLGLNLKAIEVVPWDLSQPELGLSPNIRENLFSGITTVVHGAAMVNFLSCGSAVHRVNVEGTQKLLELAAQAGIRRWLQLSTLAVCNGYNWPESHPLPERPLTGEPTGPVGAYARSKLGAEKIFWQLPSSGLEVSVLRLPYLLASRENCSANPNGYIDLMLRAVMLMGNSFQDEFAWHGLPVDQCAAWVSRIAGLDAPLPAVQHVISREKQSWLTWVAAAASAMGKDVPLKPMQRWFDELKSEASSTGCPGLLAAYAFLSLEPTHQQWMHVNAHRLFFANGNLASMVPEASRGLDLSMPYRIAVLNKLREHDETSQPASAGGS